MTIRWTILVCGDRYREDDGAAIEAAAHLAGLPPDVRVQIVGRLDPADLLDALAVGRCLVIDTVRGCAPGSAVALPLAGLAAAASGASTHALPLGAAVALAGGLGAPLERGRFLGIGGASFGLGWRLSPDVATAVPAFTDAIARTVQEEGRTRCA